MRKLSLPALLLAACQTSSTPITESEPAPKTSTCTFTTINEIALPPGKHYDHAGREIVFEDVDWLIHLAQAGYYEDGQPVIAYNTMDMQKHSPEFQAFVFYHEIGHLKRNYLHYPRPYQGPPGIEHEKEANCYAIYYFEKVLKCSPEQMKLIHQESLPFWSSEVPGFKECLGK